MRSTQPSISLQESRRRFLRSIIQLPLGFTSTMLVVGFVGLFVLRNPFFQFYVIGMSLLWAGSAISMWMIRTRSVGSALIPLIIAILTIILVAGLRLPTAVPSTFALLAMIILLVSITANRRLTTIMMVFSVLIAIIVLNVPRPANVANLTENRWISSFGTSMVLLVIWLIADRYSHLHETATRLATQHATEADAARAEADQARAEIERRYEEQHRLLEVVQSLELPVISIGRGILAVPLVGNLDQTRLVGIQKRLLEMVANEHAHVVIVDVTGIALIDPHVGSALVQLAQAVRLLGARTVMSGINASMAQTLTSLDLRFDGLHVVSDMGQALEYARGL